MPKIELAMVDKYALQANFNRYTPEATDALARIAAARARIDASEIRPAAEDELRVSALAETVHYSTLIEGNELPIVEAERAARGTLDPDTKAKIELVNYVEALHYLDGQAEGGGIEITPETVLTLHKKTTEGLGSESEHFKPRHEGAWRDGIARVVDRATGKVMHEGPPPGEVPDRMAGLCTWVAEREDRLVTFPPPVIAGVAHYALTDIHPFADGNGRVARLLSAAILMRLGFISRRLFSFERYYAENRNAYYAALRSVRAETLNMNTWLEYFLGGLAGEYERVAARIAEMQAFGLGSNARIELQRESGARAGAAEPQLPRRVPPRRLRALGRGQSQHRRPRSARSRREGADRATREGSRCALPPALFPQGRATRPQAGLDRRANRVRVARASGESARTGPAWRSSAVPADSLSMKRCVVTAAAAPGLSGSVGVGRPLGAARGPANAAAHAGAERPGCGAVGSRFARSSG